MVEGQACLVVGVVVVAKDEEAEAEAEEEEEAAEEEVAVDGSRPSQAAPAGAARTAVFARVLSAVCMRT